MQRSSKKSKVFRAICPCCQSILWIDPVTRGVIQFEKKAGKKKGSLDELLLKEKKRRDELDRKFEATAELRKKKWEEAKDKFEKAFNEVDKEE